MGGAGGALRRRRAAAHEGCGALDAERDGRGRERAGEVVRHLGGGEHLRRVACARDVRTCPTGGRERREGGSVGRERA